MLAYVWPKVEQEASIHPVAENLNSICSTSLNHVFGVDCRVFEAYGSFRYMTLALTRVQRRLQVGHRALVSDQALEKTVVLEG